MVNKVAKTVKKTLRQKSRAKMLVAWPRVAFRVDEPLEIQVEMRGIGCTLEAWS